MQIANHFLLRKIYIEYRYHGHNEIKIIYVLDRYMVRTEHFERFICAGRDNKEVESIAYENRVYGDNVCYAELTRRAKRYQSTQRFFKRIA